MEDSNNTLRQNVVCIGSFSGPYFPACGLNI